MTWIALSSLYAGYAQPTLPLSNSMCPSSRNVTVSESIFNVSSSILPPRNTEKDHFVLYKMTFMWYSFIGFLLNILLTTFAVLITGGWKKNVIPANSKYLSPITRFWMDKNDCSNLELK
nr:uncharacterized protein LOC122271802 [Parasteatoda tepidariorum]